jgi:hypothetical protein
MHADIERKYITFIVHCTRFLTIMHYGFASQLCPDLESENLLGYEYRHLLAPHPSVGKFRCCAAKGRLYGGVHSSKDPTHHVSKSSFHRKSGTLMKLDALSMFRSRTSRDSQPNH